MPESDGYHPLKPITEGWFSKIDLAIEHKKPWQEIADQCMMFFAAAQGFLWDPKFHGKLWGKGEAPPNPKFKITISKAFELVSIFGPMLYWRNPARSAEPRKPVEVPADLMAMKMGITPEMMQAAQAAGQNGQPPDPQMMFQVQQVQQFQQQLSQMQQSNQADTLERDMRAELMSRYLNWTPFQLGLHRHAEQAITEALIKGRGILWPEPYRPPGSGQTMIGSFWDTVDNFYVDPDSESVEDAWWIARKREMPTWKAERKWGLKKGELKDAGNRESINSEGERETNPRTDTERAMGTTQDLVTVYEVWSRCGIGARLTDVKTPLKDKLERLTGDYCYLALARGVEFPLNMSSRELVGGASNDQVQRAFRWPTPHYRDGKWPCAILDFYPAPRSIWPVAPLAPGLGELIALNVFIAHLCNRIWMSSRDFIGVLESAAEAVEKVISKGADLSYLRIPDGTGDNDVNKVVQFLQHPPTNMDAWKIIEQLVRMFEQRTGLSEILQGMPRTESRTATSAKIRQQNVSHRPEHMAAKVEQWQTDLALREALAVRWWVKGDDVRQLMGDVGAQLWEEFIVNSPVERTVHDIDYRIEAGSARKPNRERDLANINDALPQWVPLLQAREQQTGNFEPLNHLMRKWGENVEMDTEPMTSQPPPPQPDPQQQQAEAELQLKQQEAEMEGQIAQGKFQAEHAQKQQEHGQEMQQDAQQHGQEMQQDAQTHAQQMTIAREKASLDAALARLKARATAQPSRGNGSSR